MKQTYLKKAKNQYLSLRLCDAKIQNHVELDTKEIDSDIFRFFILFTPKGNDDLYYRHERSEYGINNSNTDLFITDFCKTLSIDDSFYPFASFGIKDSNIVEKQDLSKFLHSHKYYLFLRVGDSIVSSLFGSIRDALAHGNILKDKSGVLLFSTRKEDDEQSYIKLLMKIKSLTELNKVIKLLEEYKNKTNQEL